MEHISRQEKEKRIRKGIFRFLSLKVMVISCLFLFSLYSFAVITHEVVYGNERAVDQKVFSFFAMFSSAGFVRLMEIFTFFGSATFLFPAYVALIGYFIIRRKYRYGVHIGVIAVSSTLLMFGIKRITHRHRPDLPLIQGISNFSFPSGHALSVFIFCGIFIYMVWHSQVAVRYKWLYTFLLFCFAVTVGISRIVLRVHFPTDVMASFCLGIMWAVASLSVMRKISKKPLKDDPLP